MAASDSTVKLGSEGRHPGHLQRVADEVDGEALLRAGLGEVEPGPVIEREPERQRALAWPDRLVRYILAPAQPACPRQVDNKVQVTAGQVEELPMPPDIRDGEPGERGERGVEGLQHGERGRFGPGDHAAAGACAQESG